MSAPRCWSCKPYARPFPSGYRWVHQDSCAIAPKQKLPKSLSPKRSQPETLGEHHCWHGFPDWLDCPECTQEADDAAHVMEDFA